ncbi:exopolysaccharide biosynthesis protein [Yoonia sp. R2331]|uniref:exopolysaccharide biosynthesis protein n=1 Tax=Yoonia sp. R2331 TaxID=3237238 RepID=UPI0034E3B41A
MNTTTIVACGKAATKQRPQKRALRPLVDRVVDSAEGETVNLRTILQSVGDDSFAPVLLLPALAVATPLSGVPLFSALMGATIFLISLQMILRRESLWLPRWLLDRAAKASVVRSAFSKLRSLADWIDRRTQSRFNLLFHRPLILIPQLLCLMSGAVMPLLEFVPFSSSIIGAGVALLAFGLTSRDGLFLLLGLFPYAAVGLMIFAGSG